MENVHIILMGPPGSGKGTQAKLLAEHFKVPHLSSGDLLRSQFDTLAPEEQKTIKEGRLLPDERILSIVLKPLNTHTSGWILDGLPRTLTQAELLAKALPHPYTVVRLCVPDVIITSRLSGRRTCPNCGATYHISTHKSSICDNCQHELIQRPDDRPDVIQKRLQIYHTQTAPLYQFYQKMGNLITIEAGEQPIKAVFDLIIQALSVSH